MGGILFAGRILSHSLFKDERHHWSGEKMAKISAAITGTVSCAYSQISSKRAGGDPLRSESPNARMRSHGTDGCSVLKSSGMLRAVPAIAMICAITAERRMTSRRNTSLSTPWTNCRIRRERRRRSARCLESNPNTSSFPFLTEVRSQPIRLTTPGVF